MAKFWESIKNWRYPVGRYAVVGVGAWTMLSKRGESLKELFDRRQKSIRAQIRTSYPIMEYSEYFALPTDNKAEKYRYDGAVKDGIGVVVDKSFDGAYLTLFRIEENHA